SSDPNPGFMDERAEHPRHVVVDVRGWRWCDREPVVGVVVWFADGRGPDVDAIPGLPLGFVRGGPHCQLLSRHDRRTRRPG
ncbi:MAG: hypothetical protein AAF485_06340, partial [Chloroflexota bacterium]